MVITDIKVRKLFDDGPMKAIVSVTFDDQLVLHDIKVIGVRERNFIVMPSRKKSDGITSCHDEIVYVIIKRFDLVDVVRRDHVLIFGLPPEGEHADGAHAVPAAELRDAPQRGL